RWARAAAGGGGGGAAGWLPEKGRRGRSAPGSSCPLRCSRLAPRPAESPPPPAARRSAADSSATLPGRLGEFPQRNRGADAMPGRRSDSPSRVRLTLLPRTQVAAAAGPIWIVSASPTGARPDSAYGGHMLDSMLAVSAVARRVCSWWLLAVVIVLVGAAWSAPAHAYWIRGRCTRDGFGFHARVWITDKDANSPASSVDCDDLGYYAFFRAADWYGHIAPVYAIYDFRSTDPLPGTPLYPAYRLYPDPLTGHLDNQDFIVDGPSFSISGYVKDAGVPVSGATITTIPFAHQAPSTVTDANGHYSFTVLVDWAGTIRATKSCYSTASTDYTDFLRD